MSKKLKDPGHNEIREFRRLIHQMTRETIWLDPKPHFGGGSPHRYDGQDRRCVYCGRPENYAQPN